MQQLLGCLLLPVVVPVVLIVEAVSRLTPDAHVERWANAKHEMQDPPAFFQGVDGTRWVEMVVVVHAPICWGDGSLGVRLNGGKTDGYATPLLPYRKGRRIGMSDVRLDELPSVCPVRIKAKVGAAAGVLHLLYDGYKVGEGIALPPAE